MPGEVASVRLRRAMCREWNYTPEQARAAPVWVIRDMRILALTDEETEPSQT